MNLTNVKLWNTRCNYIIYLLVLIQLTEMLRNFIFYKRYLTNMSSHLIPWDDMGWDGIEWDEKFLRSIPSHPMRSPGLHVLFCPSVKNAWLCNIHPTRLSTHLYVFTLYAEGFECLFYFIHHGTLIMLEKKRRNIFFQHNLFIDVPV